MNETLIGSQVCEKCKFANKVNPQQLQCRRNPPQLMSAPMSQPSGGKGIQFAYQTAFPLVGPDWWCGSFVPKLAIQN